MSETIGYVKKINSSLENALETVSQRELDAFLDSIGTAEKIVLSGVGREGLMSALSRCGSFT